MAYYLTVKRQNKDILIDISMLDEFIKMSKYKNGGYSLEEIDNLTMSFDNEYFFKDALYNKGLIELDDIKKELTIKSKKKEDLEKIRKGLAYKDANRYFDVYGLKFILLSKQKDNSFIEKLLSYYRNSYINGINVSKMRYALNINDLRLLNSVLGEFYMKEISKLDSNTGELKLNYKNFHDLAMFIYEYEQKQRKESVGITTEEDKLERKLALEYLYNSFLAKESKSKVKTKEIEGQINLF